MVLFLLCIRWKKEIIQMQMALCFSGRSEIPWWEEGMWLVYKRKRHDVIASNSEKKKKNAREETEEKVMGLWMLIWNLWSLIKSSGSQPGGILSPTPSLGTFGLIWWYFWLSHMGGWRGMLLVSSGWKAGILLNILQCTGRTTLTIKN